jgi:cytoskeletal protein CcmA (bactofilin family)
MEAHMLKGSTNTDANFTLLTINGPSAKLEGKFEIAQSLHIECEVGGELSVGGELLIGERGTVKANVQTVDAIVQGTYEGNMVASGTVEIAPTGHVTGNIETDSLVIAKGGFFNGNVTKKNTPQEWKLPPYRAEDRRPNLVLETPRSTALV